MKHRLTFLLFIFATGCLWAQSAKDFDGVWLGSPFQSKDQPEQPWVFENIHDNTCTGFFWTGNQNKWSKCEIKDGKLTAWWQGTDPVLTGKVISPTQLELTWHNPSSGVRTFTVTKQPSDYRKKLGDPRDLARVDRGRMGIYRALAEVIMDSVDKKDIATAAKLSQVLETMWDRYQGDLQQKSPQVWRQVDGAMDRLIQPVVNHVFLGTQLDPASVEAAYHTFLDGLKEAEAAK